MSSPWALTLTVGPPHWFINLTSWHLRFSPVKRFLIFSAKKMFHEIKWDQQSPSDMTPARLRTGWTERMDLWPGHLLQLGPGHAGGGSLGSHLRFLCFSV